LKVIILPCLFNIFTPTKLAAAAQTGTQGQCPPDRVKVKGSCCPDIMDYRNHRDGIGDIINKRTDDSRDPQNRQSGKSKISFS